MFIYYYFSLSPTECSTTCYPLPPDLPARLLHCPKEMIKIIQRSLDRFMKNVAWILRWFHFHPKLNWFSPFPSRSLSLSLPLACCASFYFFLFFSPCFTRQFTTLWAYNYTPTLHTHTHTHTCITHMCTHSHTLAHTYVFIK